MSSSTELHSSKRRVACLCHCLFVPRLLFMFAMSFITRTTFSVSCGTGCHVIFRFYPISGEFPPSSPLSSSNLQPRNRQLSSIWNRLRVKGTTSVFGDLQQHHSTECSARCHVRVSSSPPPGFDSDRVKLQKPLCH